MSIATKIENIDVLKNSQKHAFSNWIPFANRMIFDVLGLDKADEILNAFRLKTIEKAKKHPYLFYGDQKIDSALVLSALDKKYSIQKQNVTMCIHLGAEKPSPNAHTIQIDNDLVSLFFDGLVVKISQLSQTPLKGKSLKKATKLLSTLDHKLSYGLIPLLLKCLDDLDNEHLTKEEKEIRYSYPMSRLMHFLQPLVNEYYSWEFLVDKMEFGLWSRATTAIALLKGQYNEAQKSVIARKMLAIHLFRERMLLSEDFTRLLDSAINCSVNQNMSMLDGLFKREMDNAETKINNLIESNDPEDFADILGVPDVRSLIKIFAVDATKVKEYLKAVHTGAKEEMDFRLSNNRAVIQIFNNTKHLFHFIGEPMTLDLLIKDDEKDQKVITVMTDDNAFSGYASYPISCTNEAMEGWVEATIAQTHNLGFLMALIASNLITRKPTTRIFKPKTSLDNARKKAQELGAELAKIIS